MLEFQSRAKLSPRQFGVMTVGTGLMFMLPKLADAADMKESEIEIKTRTVPAMHTSCVRPTANIPAC